MEDKWRKQIQDKMEGYEKPLPDFSWDKLDDALAKNRRQGMTVVWGKRIAAAAAIALVIIGGGIYYLNSGVGDVDNKRLASVKTDKVTPQTETVNTDDAQIAVAQPDTDNGCHEHLLAAVSTREKVPGVYTGRQQNASPLAAQSLTQETLEKDVTENIGTKEKTNKEEGLPAESRHEDRQPLTYGQLYGNDFGTENSDDDSRLIAAVYMQNAFGSSSDGMGGVSALPYGDASSEFSNGNVGFLEDSSPKTVSYDHKFPIKVGLGIRYRFNKRWSIATGLTYSYLHSTYNASEGRSHWSGEQNLHYMGLPLAVNYNMLNTGRFSLYITAGGEMQKLVSGKLTNDDTNTEETLKERRMQWSLNAAVGAQYNFTDNVGLYLEPGVVHHIDNKSDIVNYYKYKPTNFSLNLGLRLDL